MHHFPETLKVCVVPFGCQMNRADASAIMDLLDASGYKLSSVEDDADVIIYVTCTVRQHAENRAMSRLGRHARRKRDGKDITLVLAGCVAEKEGENAFSRIKELDIVCGTRNFHNLPNLIQENRLNRQNIVSVGLDNKTMVESGLYWRTSPFQAFVTIMRGCDNFCSYCIVPFVRGREYSRPSKDIIDDVKALADKGVIEVTLLGQNVNSYGKGLEEGINFADLLEKVSKVSGIERLKFVTSHPKDMTRQLAQALTLPKVCPYLHLPAQSGSNKILAAMNRNYTREHYEELITMAREIVPNVGIASDFIVGFPGETEEDYLQTRELVESTQFQQVFVFKYSTRPGTVSAKLEDNVSVAEKKFRNNDLLQLHLSIAAKNNQKLVGRTLKVLVEGPSPRNPEKLIARTDTDRIVILSSSEELAGKIVDIRIDSTTSLALYGQTMKDVLEHGCNKSN